MSQLAWYVHRLRAMSPGEVAHRLADRWKGLNDAGFLRRCATLDIGNAADLVPRLPDRATAPAALRIQLAEDAKRLLAGHWQLFGWRDVEVGAPPCWHRDPVCGVVIAHDTPSRLINHRHLPDGADARSIWEINRWTEMTRLAMHGWLNDDADAIRTSQLWIEDWCERNPPGTGINWTSPLEAALRLINFVWFDALVTAWATGQVAKGHSMRDHQSALRRRVVAVHAGWIWRHRSRGSSANNHLLGELAALVLAASRWPSLARLACSAEAAWEMLGHEVLRQFAPDGGSREQALHYHAFAFDLAWQAVRAVGCRAGEVHDRLALAARCLLALGQGREAWDFGDGDDAIVLPLALVRANGMEEMRAWLLGDSGAINWWLGPPPMPASRIFTTGLTVPEWQAFPSSGLAVLRSHGWVARLDASPLGFGPLAAHGHADALHISVWDGDLALLIDPGTGGYHGHPELRAELAAWNAHNGPRPHPAGFRTPRRLGPFLQVAPHATPRLSVDGSVAQARLTHEGHAFQRQVRRLDEVLEIHDTEAAQRSFAVRWVLAPGTEVREVPGVHGTTLRLRRAGKSWLLSLQAPGETVIALEECRASPAYGRLETAPVISVENIRSGLVTRLSRA